MTEPITRFDDEHGWLSNFWMKPIVYFSRLYASVEHAYQANKAGSVIDHLYVATSPTPGKAKRRGRVIQERQDWECVKLHVMEACLQAKFAPGTELAQRLIDTGDAELIEENTWGDEFWGVCRGKGENHLGRLLMEIRDDLTGAL